MKLFASLDPRDRKLMQICLAIVLVLIVVTSVFARNQNRNDNPLPSSYLMGRHGARAAYELLQANGYLVQRWEEPLSELASRSNTQTVVILADPYLRSEDDMKAIDALLHHGARVLVTGQIGGLLSPVSNVQPSQQFGDLCKLTPEGLDPLSNSGEIWMNPAAQWNPSRGLYRVQYSCVGSPVVVEYEQGAGHIVWWASSTPLENGFIQRGNNLHLLLNSLGTREGHNFYWDESLHGEVRTQWFYARGLALNLLLYGMAGIALLIVFSFSRRRGPVRDLPQPARASSVEFLDALGSLYKNAGAAHTALVLAYDRFRRRMGLLCGLQGMQMSGEEMAVHLRRRFPQAHSDMEENLRTCAAALKEDDIAPKQALLHIQALDRHESLISALARANRTGNDGRDRWKR